MADLVPSFQLRVGSSQLEQRLAAIPAYQPDESCIGPGCRRCRVRHWSCLR
jgi:hypothetical protein